MDEHEYYQKFEARGEQGVRDDLAAGRYNTRHAALAKEWLRKDDQERSAASQAEQASAASRAAIAAERAATATESASSAALDQAASVREQAEQAKDANRIAK